MAALAVWGAVETLGQPGSGGQYSSNWGIRFVALSVSLAFWALLAVKIGSLSRAARSWIGVIFLASGCFAVVSIVELRNVPADAVDVVLTTVVLYILYFNKATARAFRREPSPTTASTQSGPVAPGWVQRLALPKYVRRSNWATATDLARNRAGVMSVAQRWVFLWIGGPIFTLGLLFVAASVFAPYSQTPHTAPRAELVAFDVAFGLLLVVGGLPAVLDAVIGRVIAIEGKPTAPATERSTESRKARFVVIDGDWVPVPKAAYQAILAEPGSVRIYRSMVLGRFLSWHAN
jgi:hypothetical protein